MVSIIICIHNGLHFVKECIDSIDKNTSCKFQLILIDDASENEVKLFLESYSKQKGVLLMRNKKREGYTKSANLGMKSVKTEYFVLLNSDTVVSNNWITKLLYIFTNFNNVGAVGPIGNACGFQSVPEVYDDLGIFKVNDIPNNFSINSFAHYCESKSLRLYPSVNFINGFCMMIKSCLIHQIGIFNEIDFPDGYGEEIDFCIRIKRAGYSIIVSDETYVYHHKSKSYGDKRRNILAKIGREKNYEIYGRNELNKIYSEVRNHNKLMAVRNNLKF